MAYKILNKLGTLSTLARSRSTQYKDYVVMVQERSRLKVFFNRFVDLTDWRLGGNKDTLASFLVAFNDWEADFLKRLEALFNTFHVVISSTTSLSSLHESLFKKSFTTFEVQDEFAGSNFFLKRFSLIKLTWETVNQEAVCFRSTL